MAINWNTYQNGTELEKYIAYYPLRFIRYTRLNELFNAKYNARLIAEDYPEDPNQHLYGCLVSDKGETYIDFLIRNGVLQEGSKLLSFPRPILYKIREFFHDNSFHETVAPTDVSLPFIVSGSLDHPSMNTEGEIMIIKDTLGAYFPVHNIIMIDQDKIMESCKKIMWYDSEQNFPNYSALYDIVLNHELGHWIHHEMLLNGEHFKDGRFIHLDREVKEFYAQIIGHELFDYDFEIQEFMVLYSEKHQSEEYQHYLEYVGQLSVGDVVDLVAKREDVSSLYGLREAIRDIKGWLV